MNRTQILIIITGFILAPTTSVLVSVRWLGLTGGANVALSMAIGFAYAAICIELYGLAEKE